MYKKKLFILNVNCHISFRVLLKKLQVELRKIEEKFLCVFNRCGVVIEFKQTTNGTQHIGKESTRTDLLCEAGRI